MDELADRINFMRAVKTEVEKAASPIIEERIVEYAAQFGWDTHNEGWIWSNCGDIGFIVSVATSKMSTKAAV